MVQSISPANWAKGRHFQFVWPLRFDYGNGVKPGVLILAAAASLLLASCVLKGRTQAKVSSTPAPPTDAGRITGASTNQSGSPGHYTAGRAGGNSTGAATAAPRCRVRPAETRNATDPNRAGPAADAGAGSRDRAPAHPRDPSAGGVAAPEGLGRRA